MTLLKLQDVMQKNIAYGKRHSKCIVTELGRYVALADVDGFSNCCDSACITVSRTLMLKL